MDTKIKQLDKDKVQMLRKGIQQQLDNLGRTYGMTISLGNIRFDGLSFRTKLEAHINSPASGASFEQEAFNASCYMYGLTPEDYLKEVTLSGSKYKGIKANLVGFNPRAKKYPVKVRTSNGALVKSTRHILEQVR